MKEIFVLIEHRQGKIRDVTFEMLTGANKLATSIDGNVTAVVCGSDVGGYVEKVAGWAHKIIAIDDSKLKDFNADAYQQVLVSLIQAHKPYLTLIAQSGFGSDLAPSLAVELDYPLATDCYDLQVDGGALVALRQMYGGKVNARVFFNDSPGIICTVRAASFPPEESNLTAEVIKTDSPLTEEMAYRQFVEYVEAAVGDVDITQADILVGVGRGIKDKDNIPMVQELADALGGVLACSRPSWMRDGSPKTDRWDLPAGPLSRSSTLP